MDALRRLGASFVGVIQVPVSISDEEILHLNEIGVRAVRFSVKRGGSETLAHLDRLAERV